MCQGSVLGRGDDDSSRARDAANVSDLLTEGLQYLSLETWLFECVHSHNPTNIYIRYK